jgi:hypothetical protein
MGIETGRRGASLMQDARHNDADQRPTALEMGGRKIHSTFVAPFCSWAIEEAGDGDSKWKGEGEEGGD